MSIKYQAFRAYSREKGIGSFFSKMGPKMEEKEPREDKREHKQKKWAKTPLQGDFFNVGFDSSRVKILATNAVFLS